MSFLHTIFADAPQIAGEIVRDEDLAREELKGVIATFATKQRILARLVDGESIYLHLHELAATLKDELALVERETAQEHEIIDDLRFLSRDSAVQRLESLRARVGGAISKDAYLTHMLSELRDLLGAQARKIKRISSGTGDVDATQALIDLLLIERDVIEKLSAIDDFRALYRDLATGTKRESAVHRIRARFSGKLLEQMRSVAIGDDGKAYSTDGSYLSDLCARVFNHLEEGIAEAIANDAIAGHAQADVEYVQSTWFEEFVHEQVHTDATSGKIVPSDRTIDAFITGYRELYLAQARAEQLT
jgi:hypothetical protein